MAPSTISDPVSAPIDEVNNKSASEGTAAPRKHDPDASFGDLRALAFPPSFDNKEKERQYLKERLTAAVRIFAQKGFDHHVVSC